MQLGIVNEEAAAPARSAELEVTMNRCMKTEFARLLGGLDWIAVDAKAITKSVKICLMTLLLLGMPVNGYAQKDALTLPADPLTDEFYEAYRQYYYDSYHMMFEVIGNETIALSLKDFSKLSLESQYNVCSVGMDYIAFYSITTEATAKILKGGSLGHLIVRVFADVSGISWDFKRQLSEKEEDTIRQMRDIFGSEFKIRFKNLGEKTVYCIRNRLVKGSATVEFTEGYASVPMEFQVRDIYRAQVPMIRWIQEHLSESEEKTNLQTMVESMERKYFVLGLK